VEEKEKRKGVSAMTVFIYSVRVGIKELKTRKRGIAERHGAKGVRG